MSAEHTCDWSSAWPTGHPLPTENPDRLTGPEVGAVVRYNNPRFPRWDGLLMRVKARSYVWSPGECRAHGGSRLYGSKVVEWPVLGIHGAVTWKSMVVDDDTLKEVLL